MFTSHFGLKGACGIDFIVKWHDKTGPKPFILEINPRYTASMEIIEAAYGLNIYSLHLMAVDGKLPDFSLARQKDSEFHGKGIVFAGNKVKIGNTGDWEERGIKDIPFSGDEIEQGHPICTVMGIDNSFDKCKSKLFASVKEIRLETGDMY